MMTAYAYSQPRPGQLLIARTAAALLPGPQLVTVLVRGDPFTHVILWSEGAPVLAALIDSEADLRRLGGSDYDELARPHTHEHVVEDFSVVVLDLQALLVDVRTACRGGDDQRSWAPLALPRDGISEQGKGEVR